MKHFSSNKKTNAILNDVFDSLMNIHDTPEDSVNEISRYIKAFPSEPDYNIYQYGNVRIYYSEIRKVYLDAGYKAEKWSYYKLIKAYKSAIRYVANLINRKAI